MHVTRPVADVVALADAAEVPGLGFLPVNAYVLLAGEPLLVDTGLSASRPDFLAALSTAIDPADLRWIYLTHPDRDHTGSIMEVLAAAPSARLITTYIGLGILSLDFQVSLDRVFLLNPGQSLELGDRRITAFRPPVFDNPATTGFFDENTGTCFSSDCFGGLVPSADLAAVSDIAELPADELVAAQRLWTTVDSPWVAGVDRSRFATSLEPLRRLDPPVVLSSHLPPARGAMPQLLDTLVTTPDADPFVGPDQAALEHMLAGFQPGA